MYRSVIEYYSKSVPPSLYSIQTDAWFEVISVVMQLAIWHTKHAAHIAMDDR